MMQGVYTAMITPFDLQGHLDLEGLKKNIRHQIEQGVDGLVILGTTGEAPTLTSHEKSTVIQTAIKEVNGEISVIIGTGCYSTQQTIENTRLAKELGADGALIVTPYYNKPTQEGIYRHFKAVAEAVSIPIIVYNVQTRTGQNIQTNTLKRLMDIPTITAVKEASGSVSQMIEVLECTQTHRPEFKVVSGDDNLTFSLMALGGHGVISVVSNLVPRQVKQLVQSAQKGDFVSARQMHYHLMPLFRGAFIETNPIPIKAAMSICGLAAGPCRLPLCEPTIESMQILRQILFGYDDLFLKSKLIS